MQVKKQQLELGMEKQTGSKLGKEQVKDVYVTLLNFYAEYIMQNAGLDEAQAGIKIAGRNINNLRYADNTTLMGGEEEQKSLLMKVKQQSEKVRLKLKNIQKTKIWFHYLMANRWGNSDRLFLGAPKSLQMVTAAMKLKDTFSLGEKL